MKIFKSLLAAVFLFFFQSEVFAQSGPTLLMAPMKYEEEPDGELIPFPGKIKRSPLVAWVVYSDRDDNPAYNTPSIGTPIGSVDFMDKLFVINETAEFLEVVKWAEDLRLPNSSNQLKPKKAAELRVGWIKKENLLLWKRCLQDPRTHFTQKTMAVFNAQNIDKAMADNGLKLYNSPDNNPKPSKNTIKMFNFLYVYKRKDRFVLVGKTDACNIYNIDRHVLGWVDTFFLQPWPDRVCLQPNWDHEAVEARKKIGIKVSLFDEKAEASGWKKGAGTAKPNWDDDPFEKKWPGTRLRFPIFKQENGMVYTGYPTPLLDQKTGDTAIDIDDMEKAKREYFELVKRMKEINIVFVIDAGFGMKPYSNAIAHSLEQLVAKREEMDKDYTYKYGAVVYRSKKDKDCSGSDLSLQKLSLTSAARNVIGFLTRQFQEPGCSGDELNKDVNGALQEALNIIKEGNKESFLKTNYIIFIGGATGNVGPAPAAISDLIAAYDVNLSVFQAKNGDGFPEFSRYYLQFKDIFGTAIEKKKKRLAKENQVEYKFIPTDDRDGQLYRLDYPETSPLLANLNFPEPGNALQSTVIDEKLDEIFDFYEKVLNRNMKYLDDKIRGYEQKDVTVNAAIKNLFDRLGKSLNNFDLIRKFNGKNVQFFYPAWTAVESQKLEAPLFKYVIYVSDKELQNLIDEFEGLTAEVSYDDRRKAMKEAYESLITAYFGKEMLGDQAFTKNLTLEEILTKMTGLPHTTKLFADVHFNDLSDKQLVSDEKIAALAARIRKSLEELNTVKTDIESSMRNNSPDGVFYYVPEDYLP